MPEAMMPRRAAHGRAARLALSAICCFVLSGWSMRLFNNFDHYDAKKPGSWAAQIDADGGYPKPFKRDAKLFEPFAKASLGPVVAYALVNNKTDFIKAPDAQDLCQKIVDEMLATWKGEKPVVRVHISGNASYGAEANQTGDIFVNIGTFNPNSDKGVQSADELALMLGHELSHLLLEHLIDKKRMDGAVSTLSDAASLYVTASMYSKTSVSSNGVRIQADNDMFMKGMAGGLVTTALLGDVLAPSWGSAEELEADMMGVDLARRARYLVTDDEVRQFVQKHAESVAARSARIEKLKAFSAILIKGVKVEAAGNTAQTGSLFDLLKGGGISLVGDLLDKIGRIGVDHPDRATREAALVAYTDAVYGAKDTDENGRILKRRVQEVRTALQQGNLGVIVASAAAAERVRDSIMESVAAKLQAGAAKTASPQQSVLPTAEIPKQYASVAAAGTKTVTAAGTKPPAWPTPCSAIAPAPPKPAPKGARRARKAPTPAAALANTLLAFNPNFAVDAAPFTWRVHGDWQNSLPDCRDHAPEDWARSALSDYASIENLRNLTGALWSKPATAAQLPQLYDRYVQLIGTDADFPDLAVAAAVQRKDMAMAETKIAECVVYEAIDLYPRCVQYLGYDPLAKDGGGARTPEGKKALGTRAVQGAGRRLTGSTDTLFRD